ncbi:MAG: hypothetical protein ABIW47_14580 [Ginsengibacter sp.]
MRKTINIENTMAKNTDKNKTPPSMSPENYLKTRARVLPIGTCYVSSDWQEKGLVTLVVTRVHKNGNFTFGLFLVDLYCLGVKETLYVFNEQGKYHAFLNVLKEEEEIKECPYALAHNIIYGAVAYAQDLGFQPAKEFALTRFLLEEDDDSVELMDIQFGLSGKPAIFIQNEKHADEIIAILEKNAGPEGYMIIDK